MGFFFIVKAVRLTLDGGGNTSHTLSKTASLMGRYRRRIARKILSSEDAPNF